MSLTDILCRRLLISDIDGKTYQRFYTNMRIRYKEEFNMQEHMNRGVKEVIKDFPKVGEILNNAGIGCVSCELGTCLLKDIIEIHNISRKKEIVLMAEIEKAIYPEREINIDELLTEASEEEAETVFTAPILELINEHNNIKLVLGYVQDIAVAEGLFSEKDEAVLYKCIEFIKEYADKFHHSKEEEILFKYTDESSDIIKTMTDEHKLARWYVKHAASALEKKKFSTAFENLLNYCDLLKQHIQKEDTILYPYIQRKLTHDELNGLENKFDEVNKLKGNEFVDFWSEFLKSIPKIKK